MGAICGSGTVLHVIVYMPTNFEGKMLKNKLTMAKIRFPAKIGGHLGFGQLAQFEGLVLFSMLLSICLPILMVKC